MATQPDDSEADLTVRSGGTSTHERARLMEGEVDGPPSADTRTATGGSNFRVDAGDTPIAAGHIEQLALGELVGLALEGAPPPGRMIDHFEVVRLLGRGGMGEVFLARDVKLGRKVALKLISRDRASPRDLAQFLTEAQATAKFNHPNIVTIHAVGEHDGQPYVALEYVDGENLRERLQQSRPSPQEGLRIALCIAEGLAEAHAHGVLHRDLKPANVVIPADGRPRIVDFGLARVFTHEDAASPSGDGSGYGEAEGTPAYMAPEQWRGAPCTGAADVWALGVLMFEMCAGERPYQRDTSLPLPLAVTSEEPAPLLGASEASRDIIELVARCLTKAPAARPSARDVARALERALANHHKFAAHDSPYRGLLSFGEGDADVFFGRDAEVTAFVERARHQPILPLVGPSGAGKSSFVRAGVVPRMREQGPCSVIQLRPGQRPFHALAAALTREDSESAKNLRLSSSEAGDPDELAEQLRRTPERLSLVLRLVAEHRRARVLLIVDQLEELFTHVNDAGTQRAFLEAVCSAADDPLDPVRVVLAVRDDYLGRMAMSPVVREVLSHVTVIESLDAEELCEVLVKPAAALGVAFEDAALPREMVAEVEGERAPLPLLQFAAQKLWEQRDRTQNLMLRSHYHAMGGVAGALARHADSVLAGLSPDESRLARELLLKLVTPERTRRVLPKEQVIAELATMTLPVDPSTQSVDATRPVARLLGQLVRARVVTVTKSLGANPGDAMVELAHESLIHNWATLKQWIDHGHESLAMLAEVEQAARHWEKHDRAHEALWRGDALRAATRALAKHGAPLPHGARDFLDAAGKHERRRVRTRALLLATSLVGLALIAGVLAIQKREANAQRTVAVEQRRQADQQRAMALREGARAAFGQRAVDEARAKLRASLELLDSTPARSLWWQLTQEPLLWNKTIGAHAYAAAFSPGGALVALSSSDGAVYLVDAETRATRVLRAHEDQVVSVGFSPDGSRLATGSLKGEIVIWDTQSGSALQILRRHEKAATDVLFLAGGRQLLSGSLDGTLRVWDAADGRELHVVNDNPKGVHDLAVSPDGSLLATAGFDHQLRLYQLPSRTLVTTLAGGTSKMRCVAFDRQGSQLASGGADGTVWLWDVARAAVSLRTEGFKRSVTSLHFDRTGGELYASSLDGSVRAFDTKTGRGRHAFPHEGVVWRLAFDAKDTRMVIATSAGAELVDLAIAERRGLSAEAHTSAVYAAAIAPGDGPVASAGADGTVRLWSAKDGALLRVLRADGANVMSVAFRPDGAALASADNNGVIRTWDVASGEPLARFDAQGGGRTHQLYYPNNHELVTLDNRGTVSRFDSDTGRQTVSGLRTTSNGRRAMTAAADGTIAVGNARMVEIWKDQKLVRSLAGHGDDVRAVSFGREGKELASADQGGEVWLWDLAQGSGRMVSRQPGRIYDVAFHPDGHELAWASANTRAYVLALAEGGAPVELVGHASEVNTIGYDARGHHVVTSSDDGTVRAWHRDGIPLWRAPAMLRRGHRLLATNGWLDLLTGAQFAAAANAWSAKLEHDARYVAESPSGELLCVLTHGGALETWNVQGDVRVHEAKGPFEDVVALEHACAARGDLRIVLVSDTGVARELKLPISATAFAADGATLLAATPTEVLAIDGAGEIRNHYPAGAGITALARVDRQFLAAGYRDGNIDWITTSAVAVSRPQLEPVGSSPVTRIVAGPRDTLLAGHKNGTVGMWDVKGGGPLAQARLHGPIAHLVVDGERAYAASDLGRHLTWELGALTRDYCGLMREVWERVPLAWQDGRAIPAPPPAGHMCNSR